MAILFFHPSTSALDGVTGERHTLAARTPGMIRYPLYRRLDGPQGRSGRLRKISLPPGLEPQIVQPVASRYSEYAMPASPSLEVPPSCKKPR